jgi:hypothetical protein
MIIKIMRKKNMRVAKIKGKIIKKMKKIYQKL